MKHFTTLVLIFLLILPLTGCASGVQSYGPAETKPKVVKPMKLEKQNSKHYTAVPNGIPVSVNEPKITVTDLNAARKRAKAARDAATKAKADYEKRVELGITFVNSKEVEKALEEKNRFWGDLVKFYIYLAITLGGYLLVLCFRNRFKVEENPFKDKPFKNEKLKEASPAPVKEETKTD